MTKASDNLFPKVLLDMQTSAPAAPSDADWKLYAMPDGVYARSSNAAVGPFGAVGVGAVATDAIWDAAGDLAVGTGANTAARLAIGTSGYVLTSNGTTAAWTAAASSEWDQIIVKASDDTVTNSSTFVSDSELTWAVGATTDIWRVELLLLYNATTNGDFKCQFLASTGTFNSAIRYIGSDNTANAILVSTGVKDSTVTNTTDITAGGGGATIVRSIFIEGVFTTFSAACTMSVQFAQNSAQSAESAVTLIGSTMKLKQLK